MYKSFDFEKTKFFWPERSIGQIWVLLAGGSQKTEKSIGMSIITFSWGFIGQLKNSYGILLQD